MNAVRRHFLLEPGEPLLLCRSTIGTAVRFRSFIEGTGLPPQAVLSSTLCATPLPVYTDFGVNEHGRPRRRWEGTRAESMWLPLMWLPPRVSGRYQIADGFGRSRMEDDDLWAIRLGFELTASGLYDSDNGTWLDILSTVGIDITDELDLARVQDWLDGYPDEVLDDIDLSDYMDVEPTSWAMDTALAMHDDLKHASWALIADDLLGMVDDAIEPSYDLSHGDLLVALRTVAGLSEALLATVPAVSSAGTPTGATHESHIDFFTRIHDGVDLDLATPDKFTTLDFLSQARERLHAIREAYWPHLDALSRIEDGETPAPTTV